MNVLRRALDLVTRDRHATYGPPRDDYARVAAIHRAITGHTTTATDAALFMICVKLSRLGYGLRRDDIDLTDTITDLAGYVYVLEDCMKAEGR